MSRAKEDGGLALVKDEKKPMNRSLHINLKVNGQDGIEVCFRVKRNTNLKKLLKAYCDKQSQDMNMLAFLFNGRKILAKQTPDELEMEEGDEIDCFLHQISGGI